MADDFDLSSFSNPFDGPPADGGSSGGSSGFDLAGFLNQAVNDPVTAFVGPSATPAKPAPDVGAGLLTGAVAGLSGLSAVFVAKANAKKAPAKPALNTGTVLIVGGVAVVGVLLLVVALR